MDISIEIVKEIFKLAKVPIPADITEEAVLDCVVKLKQAKEASVKNNVAQPSLVNESSFSINDMNNQSDNNNILVVDDIGIVTYQLKIILKNLGYNVQVAKDIFSGLNIFIKSNYKYVVMDLFVSTEQEGYTLLHETKKIITKNNLATKIIVITASNKAENKVKCLNGGADYFIKKDAGWQDRLVELVKPEDEFFM